MARISSIGFIADADIDSKNLPKGTKGVIVTSVIAKSPAATLGVKRGDILSAINEEVIDGPAAFYKALNNEKTRSFQFTLLRDGQSLTTLALVRK
ncbi:hypothetical protein MASR2M48_29350 [Spirochaetota bacterium]